MRRYLAILLLVASLVLAMPSMAETVSTAPATTLSSYTPDELLQQWYQIATLLRENGNYPYVELSKGDSGYEVVALQTRLTELGFYQKEIVSNFGGGTYNAMRAFEKENGLTVDGAASVADQQVLFRTTALPFSGTKVSTDTARKKNSDADADATSGATSK